MSTPQLLRRSPEQAAVWLREIAHELGEDDQADAYRKLTAVLHTLRDHLSAAENAQLSAQLPTLIRGIYFEGWRPAGARPAFHDVDSMLELVASRGGMAGETEASIAVAAVVAVLARHVSAGELDDVRAGLPESVRPLFDADGGSRTAARA